MHDCWPAVLTCLVAGGLQASFRLVVADVLYILRQFGIDTPTLAGLGWTVAVLLWLRLRIERAQRPRWPADSSTSSPLADRRQAEAGDRSGGG